MRNLLNTDDVLAMADRLVDQPYLSKEQPYKPAIALATACVVYAIVALVEAVDRIAVEIKHRRSS